MSHISAQRPEPASPARAGTATRTWRAAVGSCEVPEPRVGSGGPVHDMGGARSPGYSEEDATAQAVTRTQGAAQGECGPGNG